VEVLIIAPELDNLISTEAPVQAILRTPIDPARFVSRVKAVLRRSVRQ
jgi:DNA-binding response OmpR family regulator